MKRKILVFMLISISSAIQNCEASNLLTQQENSIYKRYSRLNSNNYVPPLFSIDGAWGIKLGCHFSNAIHGEFDIIKTDYDGTGVQVPYFAHEIAVGAEFLSQRDQFLLGPKIGYTLNLLVIDFGVAFVAYTDFAQTDYRLLASAGFTMLGFVTLQYTHAVKLGDYQFSAIGNNRISFSISIPIE